MAALMPDDALTLNPCILNFVGLVEPLFREPALAPAWCILGLGYQKVWSQPEP